MSQDIGNTCLGTSGHLGSRSSGMSKARLVITAVSSSADPGRGRPHATGCPGLGLASSSPATEAEGEAAFEPRSRRPSLTDRATRGTVELIVGCARAHRRRPRRRPGHHRLAPDHHHPITVSRATINRHLARAGLVTPEPNKRPKSSYIRFEADHAQRVLAVRLHPLPAHRRRHPAPTSRSSPGSTTTPATPCTSPPTPGSPARSCSPPSGSR